MRGHTINLMNYTIWKARGHTINLMNIRFEKARGHTINLMNCTIWKARGHTINLTNYTTIWKARGHTINLMKYRIWKACGHTINICFKNISEIFRKLSAYFELSNVIKYLKHEYSSFRILNIVSIHNFCHLKQLQEK